MEGGYQSHTGYGPVDAVRYALAPRLEAHADAATGILLYRTLNYGKGEITTAERNADDEDLLFLSVGAGVPAHGKVAGTQFALAANRATRVTFIPHGCDTSMTFGTAARSTNFMFPRHFLNAHLAGVQQRATAPVLYSTDETLLTLIPMLEREIAAPGLAQRLMIDSISQAIAVALARIDPGIFAREAARITLPKWRLRLLFEFIEANLGEELGLDALANVARLSPFHFCRVFKQSTGMTPHRYVIERRIARAREMLATGGLPIEAVATACGFASQKHFTTSFTRMVGVSPGRFRRATRQ